MPDDSDQVQSGLSRRGRERLNQVMEDFYKKCPSGKLPIQERIERFAEVYNQIKPFSNLQRKQEEPDSDNFVTSLLSDIEPMPVEFLWWGRLLLSKLNIIQGNPGEGKTWLVLDVIAHITNGTKFSDGSPCREGDALFITAEDGLADTIRPRLDLLGADVSKVHCLDFIRKGKQEASLELDSHMALLESWLKRHGEVRVIAIDPLSAFLGKIDSHRNSDVRGVLGRLAKLAEKYSVAILAINHLTKETAKAIHRSLGSMAFVAAARAVWQVSPDRDDPGRKLFLPVKMNLARSSGLAFRITDQGLAWEKGEIEISADDAEAEDGETPRAEAKDWLREMLRDGPVSAKQIETQAKIDGICPRTLKYAKKELGIESVRHDGAWSWRWPKGVKP
jgi:hypothetical protein